MSMEVIGLILQGVIGLSGALISYAVYRHSRQLQRETWLKLFSEIHTVFWNDKDIQEVRYWLSYPNSYKVIKRVLVHRKALYDKVKDTPNLTKAECIKLDTLDKYLSLLTRIVGVNPDLPKYRDLWKAVFFKYWLDICFDDKKPELVWYVTTFYKVLHTFQQERIEKGIE